MPSSGPTATGVAARVSACATDVSQPSRARWLAPGSTPRAAVTVLGWWLLSRVVLAGCVLAGSAVLGVDRAMRAVDPGRWALLRFTGWDSWHFLRIAERGYLPPGLGCCDQAFFPGYPLLVRALAPLVGGSTILAGLAVAQAAGAAAVVLLYLLAAGRLGPAGGRRAAIYLAAAPYGLFLGAVYTESVFLACSVGAFLAAERRRWWPAGLLAAGAAATRVNGMFLLAGLLVLYAGQLRATARWRPRRDVLALALPLLVLGAFVGYLHARTGSWSAWQAAQVVGWSRRVAWPWEGLRAGWQAAVGAHSWDLVVSRWADLGAVVAGLALTALLLWRRRWAEATYVGASEAALVCSTMLTSAARYAVLWFPAYLVLAELGAIRGCARGASATRAAAPELPGPERGRTWARRALGVALPVLGALGLVGLSLAFAAHRWVA